MAEVESIGSHFSVPGQDTLPSDVAAELESTMRLHGLSAQELFYKWESYCMKMGSDNTRLDYDTARAFKKDIQETLERETRAKHVRATDRKGVNVTPRTGGSDEMFDMMGVSTAQQTKSTTKRKAPYETPSVTKVSRAHAGSSPTDKRGPEQINGQQSIASFSARKNAGQVVETLNGHLAAFEPPIAPHAESRVRLIANTEIKKFGYKPLAMHLSEASEILDERIDEFIAIVQEHYKLEDGSLGNPASSSTSDIVAVGRIASDTPESKPNLESLVLETSRRTGAGLRVALKFTPGCTGEFFPGQIVALRGKNATGEYFKVAEILEIPLLHPAATSASGIQAINERLGIQDRDEASAMNALNMIISSGPYTADDNLDFEPLKALCEKAQESCADVVILVGPFLDVEHPLVASGDFDLPADPSISPDQTTLTDAFRVLVSAPLNQLAQAIPSVTIILVPSVRDAAHKHMSWPQQNFSRRELGLPKQAKTVTNPVTLSLNETKIAISAADILYDLRAQEVTVGRGMSSDLLARLPRHLIQQRHFFPMFPPLGRSQLPKAGTEEGLATGLPLDISYLKLAEWLNQQPDVLILPSSLPAFAKVVEGVVVINPGTLSKRRGPGTFSQLTMHPRILSENEMANANKSVGHKVYERARVDVIRI